MNEIKKEIEKRRELHRLSIDVELSSELTKELHKHRTEYRNFLFMVENDDGSFHDDGHAVMCLPSNAGEDCIDVPCISFARLAVEVLKNPKLSDFISGIDISVQHEIGHIKEIGYCGTRRSARYREFNPESVAELYALSKAGDPDRAIDAEATFTAMYNYIFNLNTERTIEKCFKHYSDNSNNYSFPLTENALEEIARRAEIYSKKLDATIGNKLKHDRLKTILMYRKKI